MDPVWLDTQYNNRGAHPRAPADLRALARRLGRGAPSTRPRGSTSPTAAGRTRTLDLFPAAGGTPGAPVLVFIHGGWWRSLDKADHSFVAPAFNAAGAMVVVPNYALCPAVTIEDIALQMVRALAWTYRNAALHGGDPRRIVVAGHSAGGHLAAMLLCCDWRTVDAALPGDLVRDALAISGVFDLEPIRRTPLSPGRPAARCRLRRGAEPGALSGPGRPAPCAGGRRGERGIPAPEPRHPRGWGARAVPVCGTVAATNHLTVLFDLASPSGQLHRHARTLLGLPTA